MYAFPAFDEKLKGKSFELTPPGRRRGGEGRRGNRQPIQYSQYVFLHGG